MPFKYYNLKITVKKKPIQYTLAKIFKRLTEVPKPVKYFFLCMLLRAQRIK